MIHRIPDEYGSKFRFILVAAERAKQIQNGAPLRIELKSRKPAFVAIKEAEENLIEWETVEEPSLQADAEIEE
jgi:DNA-directed RNA polymerase omega subunit